MARSSSAWMETDTFGRLKASPSSDSASSVLHVHCPPSHERTPQSTGSSGSSSFSVLGRVAIAIRRFQHALNPSYVYGKRQASDGSPLQTSASFRRNASGVSSGHHVVNIPGSSNGAGSLPASLSLKRSASSGRIIYERPTSARSKASSQHGRKATLLWRPLPPLETEVRA